jgi:predicted metal-dependent phosphoesterase TrpH
MKSKVNLHVHTMYSDGSKTVPEVVSALKAAGIEYFAITDHDTLDGSLEATEYAEKYKMKHFNGIELSCRFTNGEIGFDDLCGCHILGLGIKTVEMKKRQEAHNEINRVNMQKLYKLLTDDEYDLSQINAIPARKDIIKALVDKGYAKDKIDCKKNIFSKPSYRQYANYCMDVQTAIQTIKECGGISIWAHPFIASGPGRKEILVEKQISELLDLLCNYGLDGIEVYYRYKIDAVIIKDEEHLAEKIRFMENLADSKKLIKSIGTDYHAQEFFSFDVEGIIPDETVIAYLENRLENKCVLL